jgi:hypothetical protein
MTTLPQKPHPSAADFLAAAISPALIMILVGSLVFFLLELMYGGPYADRLRWTMFWFVFAMVLISRISVEEGFGKASIYGVALAWATAMWIFRFVDFVFGVFAFLAFIWWCASKLVWDVTVIPDDEDSSGEGLMAVAGFAIPGEGEAKLQATLTPWWKTLFRNESERAGLPHAPGLWIVYFSMIALPFFGLGYALIPASHAAQRASCFHFAWSFAVSAMGLLLISSFLGLRRYLRRRYLTMPLALTRKWFQSGITITLMILVGALFLPRPEGAYQLNGALQAIGSPRQRASQNAKLDSDPEKGKGPEKGGEAGEANPGGKSVDNPARSNAEPGGKRNGQAGGFAQVKQKTASVQVKGSANLARTVVISLLFVFALYLLIRYWQLILDFFRSILGDFKSSLKLSSTPKTMAPSFGPSKRKFSSFTNPFTSGDFSRISPGELITQSFEALEAWARDRGRPREGYATAIEFGETLSTQFFTMKRDLEITTRGYSEWAYGNVAPAAETIEALERLWASMSTSIETASSLRK